MGRKLNISQPMVLDVMLAPFTESFQLVPSDTTQQWFYANDQSYSPDRSTNPLIITPVLSVFDPDTQQTYNPAFGDVKWYYLNSSGTFTRITNTTEGSSYDYVIYADGHIKVNKNVAYDGPVTLKCECPYIDPRNSGVSYTASDTIELTTNRDATILYPVIDVDCESTQLFDVFKDAVTNFTFTAKVHKGIDDVTSSSSILWYVLNTSTGTEELINATTTVNGVAVPKYPCYVSGYNSATLTLNAMYTNKITVVARVVKTASPLELYPCKAIRTLMWDDIPLDTIVHSNNSGGVRSDTEYMDFLSIVNINGKALGDSEKEDNLLFNWKRRASGSSTVNDEGWGQVKRVSGSVLRQNSSTLVYAETYLLGAYEVVMDNDSTDPSVAATTPVTDSASTDPSAASTAPVYDRS